jgi:hypothetical protein
MKPLAISSCLALGALSLFAQTAKDGLPSTHIEKQLSVQRTTGIGDSALVRAAKASGRLTKKPAQVITNETLVHEGGHFTTTTPAAQTALPTNRRPSEPTWDQMAADARKNRADAAASAQQSRKLDQQKKLSAARAAALAEGDTPEGLYNDPPALEGPIQTIKPMTPETMGQQQKPPQ